MKFKFFITIVGLFLSVYTIAQNTNLVIQTSFFKPTSELGFIYKPGPNPKVQTLEAVAGEGDTIIFASECISEGKLPLQCVGFHHDTDPNPKMDRQKVYEPFIQNKINHKLQFK